MRWRLSKSLRMKRQHCARLDASEAERRQLSERLTGLLSHRPAGSVPSVTAPVVVAVIWVTVGSQCGLAKRRSYCAFGCA
jgi:hypothetical protein